MIILLSMPIFINKLKKANNHQVSTPSNANLVLKHLPTKIIEQMIVAIILKIVISVNATTHEPKISYTMILEANTYAGEALGNSNDAEYGDQDVVTHGSSLLRTTSPGMISYRQLPTTSLHDDNLLPTNLDMLAPSSFIPSVLFPSPSATAAEANSHSTNLSLTNPSNKHDATMQTVSVDLTRAWEILPLPTGITHEGPPENLQELIQTLSSNTCSPRTFLLVTVEHKRKHRFIAAENTAMAGIGVVSVFSPRWPLSQIHSNNLYH